MAGYRSAVEQQPRGVMFRRHCNDCESSRSGMVGGNYPKINTLSAAPSAFRSYWP